MLTAPVKILWRQTPWPCRWTDVHPIRAGLSVLHPSGHQWPGSWYASLSVLSALRVPVVCRCHSRVCLEIFVEDRLVGEIEPVDDLLYRHVRIFQKMLCLKHDVWINPFRSRFAWYLLYEFWKVFRAQTQFVCIKGHLPLLIVILGYKSLELFEYQPFVIASWMSRLCWALAQSRNDRYILRIWFRYVSLFCRCFSLRANINKTFRNSKLIGQYVRLSV